MQDNSLNLAQQVILGCAIIVSTSQDIALIDVRKSLVLFPRVEISIPNTLQELAGKMHATHRNVDNDLRIKPLRMVLRASEILRCQFLKCEEYILV